MFDYAAFVKKLFSPVPPYHPAPPEDPAVPTEEAVRAVFADCADFEARGVLIGGRTDAPGCVCWLDGVVSGGDVSEVVLRPLAGSPALRRALTNTERAELMEHGAVYCYSVNRRSTLSETVDDLVQGRTAVLLGGLALTFDTRSKERRSITEPSVDKSVLGSKDAFTETFRVNTSLVRRHLHTSELKLTQLTIGRRSNTLAGVFYLEGAAKEENVAEVLGRLRAIDVDGVTALGDVTPHLVGPPRSVFPQALYTERPDRFCRSLLQGRVGVLIDGLPQGLLLPCTLSQLLRVPEDRSSHAAVATSLVVMRWAALLISLLLPALYVAVAMYHQEMIPQKLLTSIIAAKQDVPFSTAAEILGMLASFGLLQEAGLRLPAPAGTTISIIGALVVGQSAVEARVISPIAVIVVALAGIAGYTQPNQQLGAAVRLWRFLLTLCALALGMYGLMAGLALLLWRLSSLESCGVSYLYPLADGEPGRLIQTFLRPPLRMEKARDPALRGWNGRRQK